MNADLSAEKLISFSKLGSSHSPCLLVEAESKTYFTILCSNAIPAALSRSTAPAVLPSIFDI